MSAIVFVGRHEIRPGQVERTRESVASLAEYIKSHEPRHLLLEFYVEEDPAELLVLQVHPDEGSFVHHMQLGMESGHFATAYDYLASSHVDVFGRLSEGVLAQMEHAGEGTDAEVVTRVHADAAAGFDRLSGLAAAR